MDQDNETRISIKEIPVYSWHTKEEGKVQYAQFAKTFVSTLKQLRYLLEPGAVARRLGVHPGPAPANAAQRRIWEDRMNRYEGKLTKIDEHFAAALSALESSFVYNSPPRHLMNSILDTPPADIPIEGWTYQVKFQACWEALRVEYQPATAVDLSQLREQIMALTDQVPGGFDTFKSEFHRLHAEIAATQVPQAITDRELNLIVRNGIKNPTVWGLVCHNIYVDEADVPWARTFEAVSKFLTSFRQKGIDPYGATGASLIPGNITVAANAAYTVMKGKKGNNQKRSDSGSNDQGERPQKIQRMTDSAIETANQGKRTHTSSPTNMKQGSEKPRNERRCTRCWTVAGHGYKDCNETKCACGKNLGAGQPICYFYDSHPTNLQFAEKIPRPLLPVIEAFRKGKTSCSSTNISAAQSSNPTPNTRAGTSNQSKNRGRHNTRAFAANVAEELLRRGVGGNNLDQSA